MIKTYTDFITQIEGVYGVYNPALKAELAMYLPAKVRQDDLQSLYWKIREEYTTAYKTPPDLTQIHALLKKSAGNYEADAVKIYNEITATGCSLDHVILSDIRGQKALEKVFGTWPEFCRRNPDDEQWHRKNFIKAYCDCEVTQDEIPRIMYGDSTCRDRPPNMYGNKGECKKYLEYSKPEGAVLKIADTMTRDMRIGNEH